MKRTGIRLTGSVLVCIISLLSVCIPVRADETEIDIPEDITEEEAEEILKNEVPPDIESTVEEVSQAAEGFKSIKDPDLKVTYDRDSGSFIYLMPNDGIFSINVPLGGITDKKVLLKTGEDAWITAFTEDGKTSFEEEASFNTVSEAIMHAREKKEKKEIRAETTGSFDFRITSVTMSRTTMESCSSTGSFRIASTDIPLWINRLSPPYGYRTGKISVNGREYEKDREATDGSVELTRDGVYEVEFLPKVEGLPVWVSRFTRDTTAPILTFSAPLTDEIIRKEIRFYPDEQDSYIQVFLNNTPVSLSGYTASAAGDYRIVVSDTAGNENEYFFKIRPDEKSHPYVYIIIGALLLLSAVFTILTAHRRMRIL